MHGWLRPLTVGLGCGLALSGCQTTGPLAVRQGRPNYNEAIHDTSKEQLFLNMLRASKFDTVMFLEVMEVDAQLQFQGSLSGGASGIGTTALSKVGGTAGLVNGSVGYQEAPTIRYLPLQGQPLIEQISTPITADSLAKLFDSDWPLGVVLALTTDRIAPRYLDCYAALNAIMELDDHGALVLAPMKSLLGCQPDGGSAYPASSPGLQNDSLVLYFEPDHLYVYPSSEDAHAGNQRAQAESRRLVTRLWLRLLTIYKDSMLLEQRTAADALLGSLPADIATIDWNRYPLLRRIELRTAPVCPGWFSARKGEPPIIPTGDPGPVMRTRSATGIMRAAMYEGSFIQFVSPEAYGVIAQEPWNQRHSRVGGSGNFYTIRSADKGGRKHLPTTASTQPVAADSQAGIEGHIDTWLETTHTLNTTMVEMDLNGRPAEQVERDLIIERTLGHRRRYLLIVESATPPERPTFVRAHYGDTWYYIDADDQISRKNFILLAQLFSMQAVPTPSAPLTPALSIGAKGN